MTDAAQTRMVDDDAPRRLAGQNRIRLIGIVFGIAFLTIAGQTAPSPGITNFGGSSTRSM